MKAYTLHGIGDFRLEERPVPGLSEDSVLIAVKAAGICGSDIPRIYKTGAYSHPLIPGHEFAGTVIQAGSPALARLVGRRVGVFPLIPCKTCPSCQRHQYEMCQSYSYLGSRTDGGFAEYAAVPAWNLIELPDEVSMEQAAMLEPMAVAVHAIRRAQAGPKDRIAVCGLGTIGLLILLFLQDMGCENLFAMGNKPFQKELLKRLSLTSVRYCDSSGQDPKNWPEPDLFFECVGKEETISLGLACAAPGGRVQLVGNPAGDVELKKEHYWKILRKQLTVTGSWNSSFCHSPSDDWQYVIERLKTGGIHPERIITHRYGMEDFIEGFEIMRDKRESCGKVMLLNG